MHTTHGATHSVFRDARREAAHARLRRRPPLVFETSEPRRSLSLLAAGILFAGCVPARGGPGRTPSPVLVASAKGHGNAIEVDVAGQSAAVAVRSRSGIGSAAVRLDSGKLPASIVVGLYLRGLEEFRLSYDQTVIIASVSSQEDGRVRQIVVSPDGGERTIGPDSAYWMNLRVVADPPMPRIPLERGQFEIALPRDLLRGDHSRFSIHWIDFYR